jgi:hypothetical protein
VIFSDIPHLVEARPRHLYRTLKVTEAAEAHHANKGRVFTEHDTIHQNIIKSYPGDITNWKFEDILSLSKGKKLPKNAGLYGFFNFNKTALPVEVVLYIGVSMKLDQRVTKNHGNYLLALANSATHVGYMSLRDEKAYGNAEIKDRSLLPIEKALIQHWSPYLNIEENVFNYTFEPRLF